MNSQGLTRRTLDSDPQGRSDALAAHFHDVFHVDSHVDSPVSGLSYTC